MVDDTVARYRVWPDDTVQAVEDGDPYYWMSDDFVVVWAEDESDARARAGEGQYGR